MCMLLTSLIRSSMSKTPIKQFIETIDFSRSISLLNKGDAYRKYTYNILNRFHWSKAEDDDLKKVSKHSSASEDDGLSSFNNISELRPEIAWLAKALEPALLLYKWALPTGNGHGNKPPPIDRSLWEILAGIQRSKLGIKDWSLSDLTIGLYLIYLRQASTNAMEDVKGEYVSSEPIIQDLIYHTELAKGAYRDNAASLARNSMLRENNIVKFIKNSSMLRPGYYIGIDKRKKLVILGIRGTHTVYD